MLKRYAAAAAAIALAIAAGAALALVPRLDTVAAPPALQAEKEPLPEVSPSISGPEPASSSDPDPVEEAGYLLGEYGGRVSVLSPSTREPEMIFDIFVRTLPEPDQLLLREGIRVETYEELTRLIEDYIS